MIVLNDIIIPQRNLDNDTNDSLSNIIIINPNVQYVYPVLIDRNKVLLSVVLFFMLRA
jgi:hypothetical protein